MEKTRVAFVQTNPVFGEVNQNLNDAVSMRRTVDADIYVLPELFNTGYAFVSKEEAFRLSEAIPSGETTQALLDESRNRKITFVAGLAERDDERVYNSAVVVSNGEFVGKYRKIHLFYKEKLWFTPGDLGFKVFDVGGIRLGVMVCFDWLYPEAARSLALQGADIIAHPANLVLPGYAQKAMLARSYENRVFTITANRIGHEKRGDDRFKYTGMSQIVSPRMEVLASAGPEEVVCKRAEVDVSEARDKSITEFNDALRDRRTEFYDILVSK